MILFRAATNRFSSTYICEIITSERPFLWLPQYISWDILDFLRLGLLLEVSILYLESLVGTYYKIVKKRLSDIAQHNTSQVNHYKWFAERQQLWTKRFGMRNKRVVCFRMNPQSSLYHFRNQEKSTKCKKKKHQSDQKIAWSHLNEVYYFIIEISFCFSHNRY